MNTELFLQLHSLAGSSVLVDSLVLFFAKYFPVLVIIFAVYFLFRHQEEVYFSNPVIRFVARAKEIFYTLSAVFLSWIFSVLLKVMFAVPRPFGALNINPLFSPGDFSFPSGHSAFFMALAVAIYFWHRKMGLLFILFAVIIGLARIVAGVHYPFDILSGFLFGGLVSYLLMFFFKKNRV
jgi:undecaprenyl-diphosphatase